MAKNKEKIEEQVIDIENKDNIKENEEKQVIDVENKEATIEKQAELIDTEEDKEESLIDAEENKEENLIDTEKNKEENLIDTEEKQDKVVFKNPDFRAEEKEKVPPYFVEPPKKQKESDFGVKNGRTYKKIDEYHGLYTDTGEVFRLK